MSNPIMKSINETPDFQDSIRSISQPTEDSIAKAFAHQYQTKFRFDHTNGRWFIWDGSRWKLDETRLAFNYTRDLCREFNRTHRESSLPKYRTAAAVERFAQADPLLATTHEAWDSNPWLLCTPKGTVELQSGTIRENRSGDYCSKCTSVSPGDVPTPLWDSFLRETTQNDEALIRYLQQITGYCLTGITREHALFFIYGQGGNGKGVFVNTISSILGDYHTAANMEMFTASKYDRHPTELARLHNARMVTASETEEGKAWAESRIKQLTGGDPIAARYMKKDFFDFMPQFKLIFLGNHKPVLRNVDEASKRRFNIIPFDHKPKKPDKDLPEKLKAEFPGILQWAINGCLDWQKYGFITPEKVTNETETYFCEQDTFSQWLFERTEKKSSEPTTQLFNDWKQWCQQQGEDYGSMRSLTEKLTNAGYTYAKKIPIDRNKRGFIGISLKSKSDAWSAYAD